MFTNSKTSRGNSSESLSIEPPSIKCVLFNKKRKGKQKREPTIVYLGACKPSELHLLASSKSHFYPDGTHWIINLNHRTCRAVAGSVFHNFKKIDKMCEYYILNKKYDVIQDIVDLVFGSNVARIRSFLWCVNQNAIVFMSNTIEHKWNSGIRVYINKKYSFFQVRENMKYKNFDSLPEMVIWLKLKGVTNQKAL